MTRATEKLYYSISEVSEIADVKPHVLRYWETQFKMLRPKKNRAGNRMYRPRELNLVVTIRDLLYRNGYTIAGARRKLLEARRDGELHDGRLAEGSEETAAGPPAATPDAAHAPSPQLTIADATRQRQVHELRDGLRAILELLEPSG
jgi:DNA-binding transcriptional MerR regulator